MDGACSQAAEQCCCWVCFDDHGAKTLPSGMSLASGTSGGCFFLHSGIDYMSEKLGIQAVGNHHGRAAEQSCFHACLHGPQCRDNAVQHDFGQQSSSACVGHFFESGIGWAWHDLVVVLGDGCSAWPWPPVHELIVYVDLPLFGNSGGAVWPWLQPF